MSAKKRRIKRKIALLVRMDATRQLMLNDMGNGLERAICLWEGPMMALARSMPQKQREFAAVAINVARALRGDRE